MIPRDNVERRAGIGHPRQRGARVLLTVLVAEHVAGHDQDVRLCSRDRPENQIEIRRDIYTEVGRIRAGDVGVGDMYDHHV